MDITFSQNCKTIKFQDISIHCTVSMWKPHDIKSQCGCNDSVIQMNSYKYQQTSWLYTDKMSKPD